MKTISIPVIFNDGTKASVVVGDKIYLSSKLPPRMYYDVDKSYMHIDSSREDYYPSKNEYIKTVKDLAIREFAGALEIENPFFELKRIYIKPKLRSLREIIDRVCHENDISGKKIFKINFWYIRHNFKNILFKYTEVEIAEKLKCPPFGGTWQKYFKDTAWLDKANKIKGSRIYLA